MSVWFHRWSDWRRYRTRDRSTALTVSLRKVVIVQSTFSPVLLLTLDNDLVGVPLIRRQLTVTDVGGNPSSARIHRHILVLVNEDIDIRNLISSSSVWLRFETEQIQNLPLRTRSNDHRSSRFSLRLVTELIVFSLLCRASM